jgi:hypothetical protein
MLTHRKGVGTIAQTITLCFTGEDSTSAMVHIHDVGLTTGSSMDPYRRT